MPCETYMNSYTKRDCPCCGASSTKAKLVARSVPSAEELEFEELREHWRGFRKNSVFFSYYRCENCDLLYAPIYFNPDQLAQLYSRMGDNSGGVDTRILRRTQNSYFEILKNRVSLSGYWLEYGADIGLFSERIIQEREVLSLTIVEPNLNSHATLTQLSARKLTLVTDLSEIDSQVRFDGVVGIHVLDHFANLHTELQEIYSNLKIGGSVFFVTHDEHSFLRLLLRKKWPPYCLQHPQIFNQTSIENTLKTIGFREVQTEKSPNFFDLRHLVSVVFSLLGIRPSLLKFIPKVTIRVPLGNFATLATKA